MAKKALLVDYDWCTGCYSCEMACQVEHDLPIGQSGVVVQEIGPWEYGDGKWQMSFMPVFTNQCDLCASRQAKGKLPSCVQACQAACLTAGTVAELAQKMEDGSKQSLVTM